jgi:hypothetical protein
MAYLAGSAYLEWLEEREGEGSLQKLWKRMASRRGGGFGAAFRAVFGRSPADLYDRFRAEVTASAIDLEKTLRAAGLAEGDLWQRLEGGTVSPQVSPDGSKILARRDPKRGESFLAVWTIEETTEERRAGQRRREREEELLKDPNEVSDKAVTPRPRDPKWRLPRSNGFSAQNPRWMPDGSRVLFSRRAPDCEGVMRWDLYLWEIETGRVSRVTRGADIASADPAHDGTWAAGVRSRYGVTELVRIELASGETRTLADAGSAGGSGLVWTHPRVSPDGRAIAAVRHRAGQWRVVLVSGPGEAREIVAPGSFVGPPAWSPDGLRLFAATDASGIWNLVSIDPNGTGATGPLTRVTGGAFSPAPSPDGKSLFLLELTGKGTDLRRLALPAEVLPLTAPAAIGFGFPILPPPPGETPQPARLSPAGPPRPYRALETQVLRISSGFSIGPDGNSYALGVEGSDAVGRLHWTAVAAAGNTAGPRGGSIAGAWLGLPVDLRFQAFSALEIPGSQRLAPRPELDEERRGGFASASWGRPFFWGGARLEAGGGWTRVEPVDHGPKFDRALGSVRARSVLRRTRGESGLALDLDLADSFGATAGASWNQWLAGARLTGITSSASLGVSARYGDTSGSPTRFDLFALGGSSSAILPPGLDRNRVESPALPAAVQIGPRFEAYRAELSPSGFPLVLYAERMRAWTSGGEKPDWIRLEGIELRLERLIPADILGPLSLYLGAARVRSREPRFDSVRGYAGLIYRP